MFRKQPIRSALLALSLLLPALAPVASAFARSDPVYTGRFSDVAVGGYDSVAYFTEGKPVRGDRRIAYSYQGAEWHFASAANRDAFVAAPERYAPRFGGYCAWAVSQGYTASGDPRHWKIVDDRLYLNYDAEVQRKWEQDIPGFINKAEQQWPAVLDK